MTPFPPLTKDNNCDTTQVKESDTSMKQGSSTSVTTTTTDNSATLISAVDRLRARRAPRRARSDPLVLQQFFERPKPTTEEQEHEEEKSADGTPSSTQTTLSDKEASKTSTPSQANPNEADSYSKTQHSATSKRQRRSSSSSSSSSSSKKKTKSKKKKASWYHNVASKNRLGSISEDPIFLEDETEEEASEEELLANHTAAAAAMSPSKRRKHIRKARKELLGELNRMARENAATAQVDNNSSKLHHTPTFQASLQALTHHYDSSEFDPRSTPRIHHHKINSSSSATGGQKDPPLPLQLEGIGISAGKPTFQGCIGRNCRGDPMYKLGTMSFDMFRPTELILSVQGTFTSVQHVHRRNLHKIKHIPKSLIADVRYGTNPVRTYNIVTPFTIEPWKPEFGDKSPNKNVTQPIRGVMTTHGFILPYPTQNHRFSVWFTGGSLEVSDSASNVEQWFRIFDKDMAPRRTATESGKLLAAKLLMGACTNNDEMDESGKLSYSLTRPMSNYIDLIYLDKSLTILRGSSGTVYVNVRLPGLTSDALQSSSPSLDPSSSATAQGSGNDMISSAARESILMNDDSCNDDDDQQEEDDKDSMCSSDEEDDDEEAEDNGDKSTSPRASHRTAGPMRAPRRRRALSELGARGVSSSASQQAPPQQQGQEANAAAARLAELQAFAARQPPKKSALKRTSSYGNMEQIGTNIPIDRKRTAWKVLPKPDKPTAATAAKEEEAQKNKKKKAHKRTQSDPSELWSSDPAMLKIVSTQSVITDYTDSESSSEDEGEDDNNEQEGEQPISAAPPPRRQQLRKSVSFSSLDIRRYDQTVGDNPSVKSGVPISLDWTYQSEIRLDVNALERAKERNKWENNPKRLSAAERKEKLREEFGVEAKEIRAAMAEAERVKKQREFTNRYRASSNAIKVESALEAVQRKAKSFAKLWKTSSKQ